MALYDDQKVFFGGLVQFIRDVNAGRILISGSNVNVRLDSIPK